MPKISLQRTLGKEPLAFYALRMADVRPPRQDDIHLDARTLRGLAHPLRVRLLGMLRTDGPATATQLAERLGQSSAATSYHLRQLALYGFITDDPGRGGPRERWWKAAHRTTTMDLGETLSDPGAQEAGEVYLRSVAQAYAARVMDHLDEIATLPPAWRGAGTLSDILLRLTPQEADDVATRMWAIVEEYRRADDDDAAVPEGARRVNVQLQVFPHPGDPS
jgi:DNA-binding transcriptional ArsR family regulator